MIEPPTAVLVWDVRGSKRRRPDAVRRILSWMGTLIPRWKHHGNGSECHGIETKEHAQP
jgi:hypothetical protein